MIIRTLLFFTSLLFAGQLYAESTTEDASAARGEHVFAQHCTTCHGDTGTGNEPWYPSLQRLAALRNPSQMIETVITGRFRRAGEIDGHTIPIMPAWGQLTDADIAAIVNYVQQNWGNGAPVTTKDVEEARATLWEID
jgi:mono/diheme cytochrome c family protein